ncbi:NAD(P)/FAD-dependent oxidoreductase [Candidatus Woesearchaeota archaeon]|nr:NAD(P)/FAD-dependent oxidoreductase [Candidatus Woesearchaeota archaeon]
MKKHDVVIIGAGPAGLMAAKELAAKGIDFIVIDSKKEIGIPLKCGEGMRKDGFLELFRSTKHNFIRNSAKHLVVKNKNIERSVPVTYLMLDRSRFERWLAKPVKRYIRLNTALKDIRKEDDHLVIETSKSRIAAGLVILAHGCDYRIQKKFRLVKKNPICIPCYGGIFKGHDLDTKNLYFFFDEKNKAIAWVFPKDKQTANVGIGIYPFARKKDIKSLLKKVLSDYGVKMKQVSSFGGVFPSSGPIKKTYADRLLVCGNAAGHVYAGTGEGIYFALKAGQLAGKTAVKAVKNNDFSESSLKLYEDSWKSSFGSQLDASLVFAKLLHLGFTKDLLDNMFRIPTDKELINLFMLGKVPWRARLLAWLAESPLRRLVCHILGKIGNK